MGRPRDPARGSISPVAGAVVAVAALALGVTAYRKTSIRPGRDTVAAELVRGRARDPCPPRLMARRAAVAMRPGLEDAWARRCPDRPPEDVATLGPRDRAEAALAYMLLSLSAQTVTARRRRRELLDRAERVLDALDRAPATPAGAPYRAEIQVDDEAA